MLKKTSIESSIYLDTSYGEISSVNGDFFTDRPTSAKVNDQALRDLSSQKFD